ncbi:hypothetical protein [Hymenobacter metallilatus]|uniref:Uncharacterized protein n=1 Tax=Hymenobacter metallilatus TaxID=2493666 RepID=A0A428JLX0_9BACT|nr:hypothetical protein [Hymenobacter metallilatus]RSK33959.1 hypothetical protein EI290_09645 [Hymenobacter metallilatus]
MPKLTNSVKQANAYNQGGALVTVLAFATFLADGVTPSVTYTYAQDGSVATAVVAAGVKVVALDSDKDKVKLDFATQFGASTYVKQTLALVLGGASQEKSAAAAAMDLEPHTYLVTDRRGKRWIAGILNGLQAEKNDGSTGAAAGDLNGYDIAVAGAENGRPLEVAPAAFDSIKAALVA